MASDREQEYGVIRPPTTIERIDQFLPAGWGLGQLMNALAMTAKEMSGIGPSERVWAQVTGQNPFVPGQFIADLVNTGLAAIPYAAAMPKAGAAADTLATKAGQQLASQLGAIGEASDPHRIAQSLGIDYIGSTKVGSKTYHQWNMPAAQGGTTFATKDLSLDTVKAKMAETAKNWEQPK